MLFDIHPVRIDGTAMFVRALALALTEHGYRSIVCFPSSPVPAVREFLADANLSIAVDSGIFSADRWRSGMSGLRLVRVHKPAIVHLHFMPLISLLPRLFRFGRVRRIVFTDHTSRAEDIPVVAGKGIRNLARTWLCAPIDRVTTVSGYVLDCQIALGRMPRVRLCRIYNGIDLERVAAALAAPGNFRARFGIPADRVLITQISWLIEEKGLYDTVAAAKLAIASGLNVHFCLAGDGPCLDALRREVLAADLTERFTFTGPLVDPFFDGVFSASDVVCQPSRWNEAFGWVIGEAMAFGKPVVATSVGGIPEIVRDAVTGFLVPPRDTAALADRLIQLASDSALRDRMGAEGRAEVARRFALPSIIEEHLRTYGLVPDAEPADHPRARLSYAGSSR